MPDEFYFNKYHSASDSGQAISSIRVSFEVIADTCLARAERLVAEWLPEGRREGQEWVALNPTRADSHLGSFKVNLVTGQWADFATGDQGSDLISLYGYLYGLKNGQAVTHLVATLGLIDNHPTATAGASRQQSTRMPRGNSHGNGIVTPITAPVTDPPYSLEAEQATLGGLMLDNSKWPAVNRIVTEADFYQANHRLIFHAISTLAAEGKPFDVVTLGERLEIQQQLNDAGGFAYLAPLANNTPSAANIHVYAEIARKHSLERRRLAATLQKNWDQVNAITAALKSLEASSKTASSRFIDIGDLCSKPPAENWLIKHYLATDSLCLLFGDPGCGKSFLAIDIACHVATGRPWRGQKVKKGNVLYIAGEGRNGLARRFKAWFEQTGETPVGITISTTTIQLTDSASMINLADEIRTMPEQPILIIVDTINRNYGPGDENATADMTRAVASLDTLRTITGATIFGLHHSGHAEKGRGRGSSVLRASLDCEFAIEKFDRTLQIRCTKAKEFDNPPPLAWTFEKQALPWADKDGYSLDSAVLIPCDLQAPPPKPSTARMGINQAKALDLLRQLHQRHRATLEAAGFDPTTARVTKQDWYTAMETAGFPRNRRTDAKAELVQRGLVKEDGDFIYLTEAVPDFVPDFVPE